jgi:hypothetical protein
LAPAQPAPGPTGYIQITPYERSLFTLASLRLADEDGGTGRATVQD